MYRFTNLLVLFAGLLFAAYPRQQREPAVQWQVDGIKAAALEDPVPLGRIRAVEQIGSFSRIQGIPVPHVVPFLTDLRSHVRSDAAAALGPIQAKDQAPEVATLLHGAEPQVRTAATALGAMYATEHAGEVARLLRDSDMGVGFAAASALGAIQAKGQVGELVRALHDPVRGSAVFLLWPSVLYEAPEAPRRLRA